MSRCRPRGEHVGGLCSWSALASPSLALAADSAESQAPIGARQIVELSALGTLEPAQRAALVALVEPELHRVGLSLVWSATPATRERLIRANADRQTLMLATLDVRDRDLWKLIVVDVQRRRATERSLPAPGRNAAAAEGVASIIASAAAALREGLEVASASADEVLDHSPGSDPVPPPAKGAEPSPEGHLLLCKHRRRSAAQWPPWPETHRFSSASRRRSG